MNITVQSKSGEFTFVCNEGEALLHAGLRQGLSLPYECATGTCGTCRARVINGEVDLGWNDAPGFAKLRRDKGDILMCQAHPRTDCVLRVPANVIKSDIRVPGRRHGVIQDIRKLTHDVAQFELALSSPMTFEAGQFVVLDTPDLSGGRAYSMVNYQPEVNQISLVIKRKPGGGFSDWLFDGRADNAEVTVFGPLGRAIFRAEDAKNVLCIAGGSGIAGMMAILERATQIDYFRGRAGHVFFGVRTLADTFYLEELARYVTASHGRLQVTVALSHEIASSEAHEHFPTIKLASGMVHEVASRAMIERYDDVIGYIAGPPPMVDGAIKALVAEGGLSPRQIKYDKFS